MLDDFKRTPLLNNKSVFRLRVDDLALLFTKKNVERPENAGECRVALNVLRTCGYAEGLCELLSTDLNYGIIGDKADVERRQEAFGKHSIALPKIPGLWLFMQRQFEDSNAQLLVTMATLLLATSYFKEDPAAIHAEVLSIYAGLLFSAAVAAGCDLLKERQKLAIMDEINNQKVIVYRGSRGNSTAIAIRDLVVGDVVDLNQGDRVPADCILLEEMSMAVDQSIYYQNIRDPVERALQVSCTKETSLHDETGDNHVDNPDPFLFSNSKVMTGQGKALVCQVGENTLLAATRKPEDLVVKEEYTYLEQRLEGVATQITKWSKLVTFLVVLTQAAFLLLKALFTAQAVFGSDTLADIGRICIVGVVILIVSVPEGLPLAVSIAMAMSIKSLKEDEIIVKNLESVQTCAQLNDLFVGKTGTLTKGDLRVAKLQVANKALYEARDKGDNLLATVRKDLGREGQAATDEIARTIIALTDVRLEACADEAIYKPQGAPVEAGLIKFLMQNDYQLDGAGIARTMKYRNSDETRKVACLPFDQALKRKVVIRYLPENPDAARIYVQGAPEEVMDLCKYMHNIKSP